MRLRNQAKHPLYSPELAFRQKYQGWRELIKPCLESAMHPSVLPVLTMEVFQKSERQNEYHAMMCIPQIAKKYVPLLPIPWACQTTAGENLQWNRIVAQSNNFQASNIQKNENDCKNWSRDRIFEPAPVSSIEEFVPYWNVRQLGMLNGSAKMHLFATLKLETITVVFFTILKVGIIRVW